jgi:hypothetical protein
MPRKEKLRLLLDQAEVNEFDFQRWFQAHVHPAWPGHELAMSLLAREGRHYTLLFSHGFARAFWRTGTQISFAVPSSTYHRVNGQGQVLEVTRKGFTRRTLKPHVWKYHLSQMAAAVDPIEYMVRFLHSSHPARNTSDEAVDSKELPIKSPISESLSSGG